MPTKLLQSDASLISGQDHATVWKKSPESAFFESDTSFTQISGSFANGGITRCDWYNSIPNSLLVDTHMHIRVTNVTSGAGAADMTLLSVASLISKLVVYINNVEVCKINNVNNCFILEQLQMLKDSGNKNEYDEQFKSQQGRTAAAEHVATPQKHLNTQAVVRKTWGDTYADFFFARPGGRSISLRAARPARGPIRPAGS